MHVRISKGHYRPQLHADVTARLEASSKSLVPAIRAMPGCLGYYVGSDETTNTMVNVSVRVSVLAGRIAFCHSGD
jgi:quinol monooxygenase YgiN